MDPTKNRGRSKLFTCFKPVADDDLDQEPQSPPSSGDESRRRRKKKGLRNLSVALNAVIFKMSLLKKSRNGNSNQDFHTFSNKISSKSKKLLKSMKKNFSCKLFWEPNEIFRTNSNSSSSLFSSNSSRRTTSSSNSSASSTASSFPSRSGSERNIKRSVSVDFRQMSPMINRQKSMKRNNCGVKLCTNEMCVFLVCLVALVFWGKVFAIVTCTSTWLFLGPARRGHRSGKVDLLVNDVVFFDRGGEEKGCHGRVVGEGPV